jgi:hypothetical protein
MTINSVEELPAIWLLLTQVMWAVYKIAGAEALAKTFL